MIPKEKEEEEVEEEEEEEEDEEEEESGQHTLPSIHGMLECGVGVVLEGVREIGDA